MIEWIVVFYVLIAVLLSAYTLKWHIDRDSDPWSIMHDLLVAAVWPLHVAAAIYWVHKT